MEYFVKQEILRNLYYSLVYPYLQYANTYPSRLESIKRLQKKIIRINTFSDYREHTNPLFKKISILPHEKINDQAIALFKYRYFNRMLPVTFNFFKPNIELHSHNTRPSSKIHKSYVCINFKKYSIKYRGCQIWNNLPSEIINSRSLHVFKRNIKKYRQT